MLLFKELISESITFLQKLCSLQLIISSYDFGSSLQTKNLQMLSHFSSKHLDCFSSLQFLNSTVCDFFFYFSIFEQTWSSESSWSSFPSFLVTWSLVTSLRFSQRYFDWIFTIGQWFLLKGYISITDKSIIFCYPYAISFISS